ncbi:MAG: carbamoyl phosphate synthase small subunit, partial [Pyramidobacter sp.]|nr:carbamoyl phosphate synthase small subunit [Pyramidobacter sp.]
MSDKAFLILANGMTFEGRRFGASGEVTAEICFTTGMTGYLETLTDPSYHGQIVVQTFPLIGNCGVIPDDFESPRPRLSAYVVREVCAEPSNFRSRGRLDRYLRDSGVVGLEGIDTRRLTRIIRDAGAMNAALLDSLPDDVGAFAGALAQKALSSDVYAVTCEKPFIVNPDGKKHVVLWDFGFKCGIARALAERGCKVSVVPAGTPADKVLALRPDGVLLSNGPGDPATYTDIIASVGAVAESGLPVFGICLGPQLLALARG